MISPEKVRIHFVHSDSMPFFHFLSIPLPQILSMETGFKSFANHLVAELSVESLLFILESMQLKHEMMKFKLMSKEEVGWLPELPPSFMRSQLEKSEKSGKTDKTENGKSSLKGDGTENEEEPQEPEGPQPAPTEMQVFTYADVMDDFVYLKDTYVANDAPYVVNIRSKIRKRLVANTEDLRIECLELDKLHNLIQRRPSEAPRAQFSATSARSSTLRTMDSLRTLSSLRQNGQIQGKIVPAFQSQTNSNQSRSTVAETPSLPGIPADSVSVAPVTMSNSMHSSPSPSADGVGAIDLTPKKVAPQFHHHSSGASSLKSRRSGSLILAHDSAICQQDVDLMAMEIAESGHNARESVIDFDRSKEAILYNADNDKVKRMKEMVAELIADFDASLLDVYAMIERDSFMRFKVEEYFDITNPIHFL